MEEAAAVMSVARPAFSVIVPAYNAEATIDATLGSIAGQTREDLEVVVVDDGSSDGTAARVREWTRADRRFRLVQGPHTGTPGAPLNAGAREARAEVLSILASDDVWLPGYLETVAATLEGRGEAGMAIGNAWVVDDQRRRAHRWGAVDFYRNAPPPLPETATATATLLALLRLNYVTASTVSMTRTGFEALGGFDPDPAIKGCEDWDLWVRAAGQGLPMVRIPARLTALRGRPDSLSSDLGLMRASSALVLSRAIESGLTPSAERIARAHLRAIEGERSAGLGSRYWAVRRRLVRRPRVPLRRYWLEPPQEVAELLWPAPGAGAASALPQGLEQG